MHDSKSDFEPEGFNFLDSWSMPPVACELRNRKELHAVLAPVLPGPPSPRGRRSSSRGAGHRAPGAPVPGEGAAAAGQASQAQPYRPGPVRGRAEHEVAEK